MRFSITKAFLVALATSEVAVASSWFPGSKAAYNKWHETELERWLSDHDVPYPAPADRKDLESLVKNNWQANVIDPIANTGSKVDDHYGGVKNWIFDSWTESSLKAFLDHNNIPNPQPRNRDKLLTTARQNYDSIAKKAGEYAQYPGDWLYTSWSESDLKEFLDSRGLPAPQPSTRDKLIASVRRNARLASLNQNAALSSVSKSASNAQQSLSDSLFDAWSDSQLKEFLDKHGVPVPQGSRKNELLALARKNKAKLSGNAASSVSASGASAYGAASSNAGNVYNQAANSASSASGHAANSANSIAGHASDSAASAYGHASNSAASVVGQATDSAGSAYARATDGAAQTAQDAFDAAIGTWSDSRLKAYLDSRGVPVPQGGKRDELVASARLHKHKASTGYSAWTFDTWTAENLQKYLDTQGKKAKKGAKVNRDELIKQAQDSYASASKSGGTSYASVTSYLAKQTDAASAQLFDTWSDSDLKNYLDSYGVANYQGSTTNELRAKAREQYNYFKYGTSTPSGTIFAKIQSGIQYLFGFIAPAASSASGTASASLSSASSVASKSASSASVQGSKSASSASSVASKSAASAKNEL